MTNQRYDIYFSGRLIAGEAESDVRERLTRRLRIDGQQVAQLFAGGTVVVKRNVDLDTAARYRVLFRDAGAIIDIKEAEAPARTESYSRDPARTVDRPGPQTETTPAADAAEDPVWTMTLAEPRTGSLIDCAKPLVPAELPDISRLSLASENDLISEPDVSRAPKINTDGLSVLPARTGDLRDCAKPVEPAPVPDISGMKLEDDR